MYYLWERDIDESKEAFVCALNKFQEKNNLVLLRKIEQVPEDGLVYRTDNKKEEPEDYLSITSACAILVSEKIAKVLKPLDLNIQFLPSKIIKEDGTVYDNFCTLNIMENIYCVDMEKSIVEKTYLSDGTELLDIRKLVLDESKIPKEKKIFHLGEEVVWLIVHQDVVDLVQAVNPTGIKFIPVEEFNCI